MYGPPGGTLCTGSWLRGPACVLHWPGPVYGGGDIFSFLQRPYRLVVALTFPTLKLVFSSNSLFLFMIPSLLIDPRLKLQRPLLLSFQSAVSFYQLCFSPPPHCHLPYSCPLTFGLDVYLAFSAPYLWRPLPR